MLALAARLLQWLVCCCETGREKPQMLCHKCMTRSQVMHQHEMCVHVKAADQAQTRNKLRQHHSTRPQHTAMHSTQECTWVLLLTAASTPAQQRAPHQHYHSSSKQAPVQ